MIGFLKRLLLRSIGWLLQFRLPSLLLVAVMKRWPEQIVRFAPSLRVHPGFAGLLALRRGVHWQTEAPPAALDAWRRRLTPEADKRTLP